MSHSESQAYKILQFIKENYNPGELDILEEFIEEQFPESYQQFKSDNYDGPSDVDYNAPSAGEINEQMAKIQRDIK